MPRLELIINGSGQNEKELFGTLYTENPRSLVQASQLPFTLPTIKLFTWMPLKWGY